VLQILEVERFKTDLFQTESGVVLYFWFSVSQVLCKMDKCKEPLSWKRYSYLLQIIRQVLKSNSGLPTIEYYYV
jgi:hypothetical protein